MEKSVAVLLELLGRRSEEVALYRTGLEGSPLEKPAAAMPLELPGSGPEGVIL